MSAPVQLVRDRLEAGGWEPRGPFEKFRALCPAHNDKRNPSLIVTERDDRVLLRCMVGCDTADVVSALGLQMRDLFEASEPGERRPPRKRKAKRRPNQLPASALPVDRVLAHYAPNYRATAALNMWLATCKVCAGELWIHAELDEETQTVPSGAVTLRCDNACFMPARRRAA